MKILRKKVLLKNKQTGQFLLSGEISLLWLLHSFRCIDLLGIEFQWSRGLLDLLPGSHSCSLSLYSSGSLSALSPSAADILSATWLLASGMSHWRAWSPPVSRLREANAHSTVVKNAGSTARLLAFKSFLWHLLGLRCWERYLHLHASVCFSI